MRSTDATDDRPDASGRLRRLRRLPDRIRRVLRIARWETSRTAGTVDRRTALLGLAVLLLAGTVLGVGLAAGIDGAAVDRDIYRVGVEADSPYHEALAAEPAIDTATPEIDALGDRLDAILLERDAGVRLLVADDRKGAAAASAVRDAVRAHNERLMAAETDRTAAYPVNVTVRYVQREVAVVGADPTTGAGSTDRAGGTTGDGGSAGTEGTETTETGATTGGTEATTEAGTSTEAGDANHSAGSGGSGGSGSTAGDESGGSGLGPPSIGGGASALFGTTSGSPASISPPFPFASLVLAFAFLVPLNVLIQAYGSTILGERVNRRGELLLVSPATRGEIVAGKTLPYLLAAVLMTVAIAAAVGGGVVSVLAVVPIALVFLAATFLAGMFARSFTELTFLTVTVTVVLTSYVFVPAIFTTVTPIALISPLTLVVRDLQGAGVGIGEYLFSTGPFYVAGTLLFVLGTGTYREEDMFTQKRVPAKLLDALAGRLTGLRSVAVLAACTIPFVFLAELLAVAVLFAAPVSLSVPVLLIAIAGIEEVAKSLPVYAGFQRGVFPNGGAAGDAEGTVESEDGAFAAHDRLAIALGIAAGAGFFLGEKLTAAVQVVGLPSVTLGRAAFTPSGVLPPNAGDGTVALVAIGLFLAPLTLHATTAAVSALGARRGRGRYVLALVLATGLHAAYNYGVVSLYG
ncbi:ABC transporter permease subunit [Halopenitus persicus]|uniref:ABC-type transport system permease protein n=1 Tax=Halopenitus persicus TaxID=1048396 RepID=A0A1H3JZF7_9EURY|nr:ABC transporter permease subunit [Halopenitus persicus]SDY44915.1 ABC-type transport system permease protein [Halopenitus persicus]